MPGPLWSVAVVGPGGVGGLLGGVLTRAGHPVTYVARPETATALNAGGMSVRSAQFGEFSVPAVAVSGPAGPVDAALLAVKATALAEILPDVPDAGLIVPFLNGVDHMAALRERFPAERVVAGAIRVESTRVAPGRIEHTSPFSWIELASQTAPRPRVEELAVQMRRAGFEVKVRDSETAVLWDKLAFLAPLALLTTHAAEPAGVVRERRRADLAAVIAEVAEVAVAAGAHVEAPAILAMFDRVPPAMRSSMQRDAEAGRALELDAIGGAVLRAADRYAIAVPATRRIVNELM